MKLLTESLFILLYKILEHNEWYFGVYQFVRGADVGRVCRWLQQLSGNVTVVCACKNSAVGSLNFRECRSQGGGATLGQPRPSAHLPWLDALRAAAVAAAAAAALRFSDITWKTRQTPHYFSNHYDELQRWKELHIHIFQSPFHF